MPTATKSEGVGLIVRVISFQDFQPMWSWSTNVTDRQTYGQTEGRHVINRKTALCTIAHHAVKTDRENWPGTGVRWTLLAEHQPTGNIFSEPAWQHRWFPGVPSSDVVVVRSSNSTMKNNLLMTRTTVAGRITDGRDRSRASSFQPSRNLCSTTDVWSWTIHKHGLDSSVTQTTALSQFH